MHIFFINFSSILNPAFFLFQMYSTERMLIITAYRLYCSVRMHPNFCIFLRFQKQLQFLQMQRGRFCIKKRRRDFHKTLRVVKTYSCKGAVSNLTKGETYLLCKVSVLKGSHYSIFRIY